MAGSGGAGVPAGTVVAYGGDGRGAIPQGWLLCDGSEVTREQYPQLFAAIGTLYGAGDGDSILHEGIDQCVYVQQVSGRALLCVVYEDHQAPHLIERWAGSAATRLAEHFDSLTEVREM